MHYLAYVVIPPDGDPQELVDKALAPFAESVSDDGWWDWHQIGGRWTGHLDGYDPRTDPVNQEVCDICNGTGLRDWSGINVTPEWIAECNGCNGCRGLGVATKWATRWADHPGDVMPVRAALAKTLSGGGPHTLLAGETVLHRSRFIWDAETRKGEIVEMPDFDAKVVEALTSADPAWRVAVVDYHS